MTEIPKPNKALAQRPQGVDVWQKKGRRQPTPCQGFGWSSSTLFLSSDQSLPTTSFLFFQQPKIHARLPKEEEVVGSGDWSSDRQEWFSQHARFICLRERMLERKPFRSGRKVKGSEIQVTDASLRIKNQKKRNLDLFLSSSTSKD